VAQNGEIMETIKLKGEYIKLGQALKAAGTVGSGVDAKYIIEDGLVSVNGQIEMQRGKKLRVGDVVTFEGNTITIE
jgi:ribosome-associated protein